MSEDAARCNFIVGQRAVCIDDEWPEVFVEGVLFPSRVPMLNEVLTVTSVLPGIGNTPGYPRAPGIFLTFAEIEHTRTIEAGKVTVSFLASHFRPLVERKTDISQFQKLLLSMPAKEFV
jgi:hypothetical protein